MTHFDDLEAQAAALDEECPVCRVPSGTMCVGQVTRETMRATHWQRIKAAELGVAGPSEDEFRMS